MSKSLLIKDARVIDSKNDIDASGSILIKDGKIASISIGHPISYNKEETMVIDASPYIVTPGLVDLHVHLREPGFEHKETIQTGTYAAIRGGFTAVCPMANTNPVNDNATVTSFMIRKAIQEGYCYLFPVGAITKGQNGLELAEMALMCEAGAVAFSDDGKPVMNSLVMRRALEYSKYLDVPIISHAEDDNLSDGGLINEGHVSSELGIKGIPSASEEVMIARDLALARLTGGRLHIAHVSTKWSVELIRRAKVEGINVTAETCPHYFTLSEQEALGYNTLAKVNPPLRTEEDMLAIKEGLRDGTIDVIATDHAPHHKDEKLLEFDKAPFGISGFDTALSLSLNLVREGLLTYKELFKKLSSMPASIIKIKGGSINIGDEANLIIIDTEKKYILTEEVMYSKGKNTPFLNRELQGKVVYTIFKERIYHESS